MKRKPGKYYDEWTIRYLNSGYGDIIQAHRPKNVRQLLDYTALKTGMRDGLKVLDAGCGVCGPALYFVEKYDVSIDAVSISEKQIQIAKNKVDEAGKNDRIRVTRADFHHLDQVFPANSFDLILFLESYGYAKNHRQVLQSAAKVLKPGGRIYIKDYFKKENTGSKKRKKAVKRIIRNMNQAYAYNLPDLNLTISQLRQMNLTLLRVNKHELPLDNESSVLQFEKEHGIDIFEGGFHYAFLDPLELLFFKPENVDDPIK